MRGFIAHDGQIHIAIGLTQSDLENMLDGTRVEGVLEGQDRYAEQSIPTFLYCGTMKQQLQTDVGVLREEGDSDTYTVSVVEEQVRQLLAKRAVSIETADVSSESIGGRWSGGHKIAICRYEDNL